MEDVEHRFFSKWFVVGVAPLCVDGRAELSVVLRVRVVRVFGALGSLKFLSGLFVGDGERGVWP